jgi:hypothetical protein
MSGESPVVRGQELVVSYHAKAQRRSEEASHEVTARSVLLFLLDRFLLCGFAPLREIIEMNVT